MLQKRVAIFFYYEWLSAAPSLISTIRFLTENGYFVDIVHLYNDSCDIFKPESDKVTSIPVKSGRMRLLTLLRFFTASLKRAIKHRYSFLIGVDQEGVTVSGIFSKIKKIPNIYYSLEILTKEDIFKEKPTRRLLLQIRRLLENYFSRQARVVIVQDKYRAEALIEDKLIDEKRIFIVPNSYYFYPDRSTNFEDLNISIPTDKKIIIYAGSILPEMAIEELITSINFWPKNTILILHAPYRQPYLEEIELLIQKNNLQRKVIISLKQLSFEELFCLLKKADIGISLYRPVNKSFALATSGKLGFYLSQGLPVISSRIPSAVELISKYNCGVCIDSPEEIGEAVKTILDNYSRFSLNTQKCYEEELDFPKNFKKVLESLEQ